MNENKKADELAAMIDKLMSEGSGHINVSAEDIDGEFTVSTGRSLDCGNQQSACCVPTIQKDMEE